MTNKTIILLAAGIFTSLTITPAAAAMAPCTTNDKSAEVPSGVYVDKNGRKWTGYNEDGTVSSSLVENTGETVCYVYN